MEALFSSTLLVALAEIGDKTQLLAILLASRFRRPVPIICGIFIATLLNHALAALLGAKIADVLDGHWFRVAVALAFVAMGLWTLIPDTLEERPERPARFGAFLATAIAFFLVEMGDKTQIATIALGARFQNIAAVTTGTTLGMMIANVPVVLAGNAILTRVPLKTVRLVAALLFVGIGAWLLFETVVAMKV